MTYERILVDRYNINNLYMQRNHDHNADEQWEIRMYSEDITLLRFCSIKECIDTFNKILVEAYTMNKKFIFNIFPKKNNKYTIKEVLI